jgi:hypothetical protein
VSSWSSKNTTFGRACHSTNRSGKRHRSEPANPRAKQASKGTKTKEPAEDRSDKGENVHIEADGSLSDPSAPQYSACCTSNTLVNVTTCACASSPRRTRIHFSNSARSTGKSPSSLSHPYAISSLPICASVKLAAPRTTPNG